MFDSARLTLRRFTLEDLDAVAALTADPEVMRYLDDGRPMPREQVRAAELPRLTKYNDRTDDLGYWAAHRRDNGEFVGWFAAIPRQEVGLIELGYRLARAAWGHGYASEGARAVIDHAFTATPARRVIATTMAVNVRSRRVMDQVGLRHVRTWFGDWPEPIPGAEAGDVDYVLERVDWERRLNRALRQQPSGPQHA